MVERIGRIMKCGMMGACMVWCGVVWCGGDDAIWMGWSLIPPFGTTTVIFPVFFSSFLLKLFFRRVNPTSFFFSIAHVKNLNEHYVGILLFCVACDGLKTADSRGNGCRGEQAKGCNWGIIV